MNKIIKEMIRVGLTISVGLTFIWLAGCSREPTYNDIGLSRWVKQLSSDEPALRQDAAHAIGGMGKQAHTAEADLRAIARRDPLPVVRVAAINALGAIGATTTEFDAYLKEVTAPLLPRVESKNAELGLPEDKEGDGEYTDNTSRGDDDIAYLQELEGDSTSGPSQGGSNGQMNIPFPSDTEAREGWAQQHRTEAIENLLQEIQNPEVLAQMVNSGDALQRRFAARMLQNQDGGPNANVFDALARAKADSDSVLRNIAVEALKKWTNQ